jgi:hypothetical protein
MDLGKVAKAIAGAVAAGVGGAGTAAVVIPPGVSMPWYGYVVVAVVNAALGFAVVYFAPKNAPSP